LKYKEYLLYPQRYITIHKIHHLLYKPMYQAFRRYFRKRNKGFSIGGSKNAHIPKRVNHLRRNILSFTGALGGFYGLLYIFADKVDIPYTSRKKKVVIPLEYETKFGKMMRDNFLRNQSIVHPDHELSKRIEQIGNNITRSNGLPDHEYILVDSPVVNAFVFPGNTVFVFRGILNSFENDSGAALVLSHELSHVMAGHAMSQLVFITPIGILAYFIGGEFLAALLDVAISLPFSRKSELEADTLGFHMMAKCCYNINDSLIFYKKMLDTDKSASDYLSTHPSWSLRIDNVKSLMNEDSIKKIVSICPRPTKRDIKYDLFSRADLKETLPTLTFQEYEKLKEERHKEKRQQNLKKMT